MIVSRRVRDKYKECGRVREAEAVVNDPNIAFCNTLPTLISQEVVIAFIFMKHVCCDTVG